MQKAIFASDPSLPPIQQSQVLHVDQKDQLIHPVKQYRLLRAIIDSHTRLAGVRAMKKPSLPVCLSYHIERKRNPKGSLFFVYCWGWGQVKQGLHKTRANLLTIKSAHPTQNLQANFLWQHGRMSEALPLISRVIVLGQQFRRACP